MASVVTAWFAGCIIYFAVILSAQADEEIRSRAQQNFATAVVLTDSDAIQFGVQNFNPNSITPFNNDDIGDDDSLDLRNKVAVTSFPYSWELNSLSPQVKHEITVRASYVHFENTISLDSRSDLPADTDVNEVYDAFFEYRLIYNITDSWNIKYGLGNHFMYFKNKHFYNSRESEQLKPFLDGYAYNTSSRSYIAEPNIELNYELKRNWGYWKYTSSFNYFYGKVWDKKREYDFGNPKGWYMVNGLKANYNLTNWDGYIPSAYTSFKRIDLKGDPVASFGTDNYYEFSVGLLLTPPIFKDYIDNVGIGINMNYGSALKGGSLVLFFNE